jgi:hypothetical protein
MSGEKLLHPLDIITAPTAESCQVKAAGEVQIFGANLVPGDASDQ